MINKKQLLQEIEKELNDYDLLVYYRDGFRFKLIQKDIIKNKCLMVVKK